jgi:2-keto-4-pentenoate hydratase/2-oxohepta-3-ene-1,7-dioic acid hydratase in catechol pathway
VLGTSLYDAEQAKAATGGASRVLDASVADAIGDWQTAGSAAASAAEAVADAVARGALAALAEGSYRLCAPYRPSRIFATASNYHEHAREMGTKLAPRTESSPYIFIKADTSVADPGADVIKPREVERLDWEVELGVVIGRGGRRIGAERAAGHIAGYLIANDVSARDMNRRSDFPFKHDWFRGKSWDTFCPLGPLFVPRACVPDPQRLRLWLSVNGERMQDGSTAEMIFDTFEQIAYLSMLLTLAPGDLILTGTPAGVGMGRDLYLKPGDFIECGIEGLGTLANPVAAEEMP